MQSADGREAAQLVIRSSTKPETAPDPELSTAELAEPAAGRRWPTAGNRAKCTVR